MKSHEAKKRYTYKDYIEWDGRWELIDGIPYNMTPAPSTEHQRIVGELYFAMRSFLSKGTCQVFISPLDILLSASEDDENPDTVVQPDISVFCHPEQIEEKGAKGAPTLVIEVLSPSTAFKDRNEKFYLYERFGVQEYWIVDPAHQTIEIYGLVNSKFAKRNVLTRHSFRCPPSDWSH
ncbi:Uma2 family endonuclease [Parageobacillus thermoglucosidasius]|uniref:Uma2 family endonuclease n=1 Tax=Parageobacillus thermoglucosidasius TaxID=1426 RepID=UPI00025B76CB|nr:Uma2 family endonuclease [Parageobacillus thermoglucosidasius]EID44912.1 hypothetical protein GT20_1086 [Parageobacillus thermoglucosidasius TNO-09.020]KYD16653.1 hypothetical protein B4168_1157 [Anoxybacillus flavithermus]OAO88200.1 hypothetical protein GT23_0476 [Parageobacillus thermoglucosidasius]GMO00504.1 Uma2 family endonuclease [Parageobacillus thermoglucosidasius]